MIPLLRTRLLSMAAGVVGGSLALAPPPASATPPTPAHWTADPLPAKLLAPGARFTLTLNARIDPGWHIYALEEPEGGPLPTEVGLAEGDPVTLLRVDESQPRMLPDLISKQPTGLFLDAASFTLHLQTPRQPLPHDTVLHIQVRYQSCNDKLCLPPHTEAVAVPLAPALR